MIRVALVTVAVLASAMVLTGCSGAPSRAESATPAPASQLSGGIVVFAAASLTDTFTDLAARFEGENPGVTVTLNFAGSSGLVTQLAEGAAADVFASADEPNMQKAVDEGLVTVEPTVFATNTLEIAVPPGNPAGIGSFSDLAEPGLRLVVCAPEVPCGAATARVAEAIGTILAPVSEESAVTDVLGKVVSGEADAGVVYRTDVAAAGDTVEGIEFSESAEVVNRYPVAVLDDSAAPEVAAAFVAFVTGAVGRRVLTTAGFGMP